MRGLSSLLVGLGLVGVVFALLSFLAAIFSGVPFDAGFDFWWIGTNALFGVGSLVWAAALNLDQMRERLRSGEARRAGKYGTSAVLGTLLGIAILGMLGFLGTRYHERFDWSEAGIHTLSGQTLDLLAGLESDVQVQVLVAKPEEGPIRGLLDRYEYESERLSVEYADPNVRPGLLEEYEVSREDLGRALLIVSIGDERVKVSEIAEAAVTNALVKLTRQGEKVVYFMEGHGERAVEDEAGSTRAGYARAADALRNENYRVETLLLASLADVPEDADVVIVADARRPLLAEEVEALERYLARGGALMALVDPRSEGDWPAQLGTWGVELGDDVVIDRTLALFGRATTPMAAAYDREHEITRGMREPALFHEVRSVSASGGAAEAFTQLVFTSEDSWAERDLQRMDLDNEVTFDGQDVAGPVSVAVVGTPSLAGLAVEEAVAPPRLAVFGDSDFASNEFLDSYLNRDLFVNTVNWLIGDVEAISIRPNLSRASSFQLSQEQFFTIRSLSLFVFPEAIAALGVFAWWSRRHPPH